jgi:hypothetical protein
MQLITFQPFLLEKYRNKVIQSTFRNSLLIYYNNSNSPLKYLKKTLNIPCYLFQGEIESFPRHKNKLTNLKRQNTKRSSTAGGITGYSMVHETYPISYHTYKTMFHITFTQTRVASLNKTPFCKGSICHSKSKFAIY